MNPIQHSIPGGHVHQGADSTGVPSELPRLDWHEPDLPGRLMMSPVQGTIDNEPRPHPAADGQAHSVLHASGCPESQFAQHIDILMVLDEDRHLETFVKSIGQSEIVPTQAGSVDNDPFGIPDRARNANRDSSDPLI
jgi:hypothetical protein